MRVLLVRPELGAFDHKLTLPYTCLEPYALSILAGLTPPDVEVEACDDRLQAIPYGQPFDLVALSVGTFQARRAYAIADAFRERGVPVVMGGFHPTFCPDEAADHADAVALGEAERLWPAIVRDARAGSLQPRYQHDDSGGEADFLPRPAVHGGKRYLPMAVVQFTRGCRHNCDFCCIKAFYRGPARHRSTECVVREIIRSGRRWIFFVDDNLVANREAAKRLLRAIAPMGLRWVSQVSLDLVDDPELLGLMVRSGCQAVVIGLESLNERNLRQMGKGWSRVEEYKRRLARIRDSGIMVYATFVFGYDGDTQDDFERTLEFALEQRFFMANFNHLQPYPGTRLYERLRAEGRLVYDRWWLDPRYRFGEAVFHPRGMSREELTAGAHRARARFHSLGGILQRALDRRANLASPRNFLTYLATNLVSRQDIHRKQGMALGATEPEAAPRPAAGRPT